MENLNPLSRRRALKTIFCSSAALSLNLLSSDVFAAAPADGESYDLLLLGDFGTTGSAQKSVAAAMAKFCEASKIKPHGVLMVGDNIYAKAKGEFNTESQLWKDVFEDMYPASSFACPFWAILGNHDYSNNLPDGEKVQLAYAKKPGVRWNMPAKWYRFDVGPKDNPVATIIGLDSNMPAKPGATYAKTKKPLHYLTPEEEKEQDAWFEAELKKPRAPFTIVMGHHPLYSNSRHGDSKKLIAKWGSLLQEHKVHAYLCGHDHDLQHLELEGLHTSFVLSGAGGASLYPADNPREIPFAEQAHGFTHIRINKDKMVFSHHSEENKLLHSFTKNVDGSFEIA